MQLRHRHVYVVERSEAYGFGSFPPVVFEAAEEADEFIQLDRFVGKCLDNPVSHKKHFVKINSIRYERECQKALAVRKEERERGTASVDRE